MLSERNTFEILGRRQALFGSDLNTVENEIRATILRSSFLVLGGAGSIGQAVTKALFCRNPKTLHVIDLSENNLVELVRDLRSSYGYIDGDFQTLPLDVGQAEFNAFMRSVEPYDYVLNLSALKHVRSEKDPFSLMRMVTTNILHTEATIDQAIELGTKRYFAVSSDKAANPANAMGATKRAMELCLARASSKIEVASARFANVAFSDGSLLHGFTRRLDKRQPIAAPEDVLRYFITAEESATLCLLACLRGNNLEAFFPKTTTQLQALSFRTIAERFLHIHGLEAYPCETEDEARSRVDELHARGLWPCYFFTSDTTGEKNIEEFHMAGESCDMERYREIGVVQWSVPPAHIDIDQFLATIRKLRERGIWTKTEILKPLYNLLPEFRHLETGKYLDARM